MRERRRIRLIECQLQLAKVARRETLAELSDAVAEEERTALLVGRTRTIAGSFRDLSPANDGAALFERASFTSCLEAIARDAERVGRDAGDRARAQALALAETETREKRLSERLADTWQTVQRMEQQRSEPVANSVARGLHGQNTNADAPQRGSRERHARSP